MLFLVQIWIYFLQGGRQGIGFVGGLHLLCSLKGMYLSFFVQIKPHRSGENNYFSHYIVFLYYPITV